VNDEVIVPGKDYITLTAALLHKEVYKVAILAAGQELNPGEVVYKTFCDCSIRVF